MAVFDEILAKGVRAGQLPGRTNEAIKWYRKTAEAYTNINTSSLLQKSAAARQRSTISPGDCFMYQYDPKHKATLPYYDRFPIVFPVEISSDRFYGLNFHYLPLPHRALLLDQLYATRNNDKFDESTKLRMNYEFLKASSQFRFFRPCFKQYLGSHIRSRLIYIYPSEWDIAMFLPTHQFVKADVQKVWSDSRKSINAI